VIVVSDPRDLPMIDELSALLGTPIKVTVGSRSAIESMLKKSENSQRVLETATEGFEIQLLKDDEAGDDNLTVERLTSDISPIIRLVDSTIFTALQRRASDIHIETQDDAVNVKYRIDGVLQPAMRPMAKQFHSAIISRIKVMAELDIAEKQVPQTAASAPRAGKTIDFRVSIMPSVHGRTRSSASSTRSRSASSSPSCGWISGLPEQELRRFRSISPSRGMVLVTGRPAAVRRRRSMRRCRRSRPSRTRSSPSRTWSIPVEGHHADSHQREERLTFAGACVDPAARPRQDRSARSRP
jgi:type IV pilus assembly protein PilB